MLTVIVLFSWCNWKFCKNKNLLKTRFIHTLYTKIYWLNKMVYIDEHVYNRQLFKNPSYNFISYHYFLKYLLLYPCYLQSCHHDVCERILARSFPRILPQLPVSPRHPAGRGCHDGRVPSRQRETQGDVRLGMLVLQDARVWLHVYGIPVVKTWLYSSLLEVYIFSRTCCYYHISSYWKIIL